LIKLGGMIAKLADVPLVARHMLLDGHFTSDLASIFHIPHCMCALKITIIQTIHIQIHSNTFRYRQTDTHTQTASCWIYIYLNVSLAVCLNSYACLKYL